MAFNSLAAFDEIKGLWLPIIGAAGISEGEPESTATRRSVFMTGGRQTFEDAHGTKRRRMNIFSGVYHRVGGAERTAERDGLAAIDAFATAFFTGVYRDRTLRGTVDTAEIFSMGEDIPLYLPIAGIEYRVNPVIVQFTQRLNIGG